MDNLTDVVVLISVCINALLMYLLIKSKAPVHARKNLILFHLYMREYLNGLSADNCPYLHELNAIGYVHSELNPALAKVCSQIVLENPQHTTPFPFIFKEDITC